ncbi:SAV_915 family protein [Actinophytocola sp. KF-1]
MEPDLLIPPVVYVACDIADEKSFVPDLLRTADGRVAILAYSALDRLIECCGEHQPWAVMPTSGLEAVRAEVAFDVVALDVAMPEARRRTVV